MMSSGSSSSSGFTHGGSADTMRTVQGNGRMLSRAAPQVIIRLKGGLGNQLFMYAFAKSMAVRNMVPLRLDTLSGFAGDTAYRREYQLHHFTIDEALSP